MTLEQKKQLELIEIRVRNKYNNSFFNKSKYAYQLGVIHTLQDTNAPINSYWMNNLKNYGL